MIPLMKVAFSYEQESRKVLSDFILSNKQLSMGEQCRIFEKQFAKWQGRKYAVLVNSGSSANLVLLQTLKNMGMLNDKDAIGISGLTWATNVMPVIQLGFEPVPIDCDLLTLNVSSITLKETLDKKKIKVLFLTNALGFCSDIDNIRDICEEKGIILLEDNCESLGTEYKGIKLGNLGLASTFSFFVAHHMSTIEGGMICTDDQELYNNLLMVRANGWNRNVETDYKIKLKKEVKWEDEFYLLYIFYDLAFNVRPTEITGILGQKQLTYLDETIQKRGQNYTALNEIVSDNRELVTIGHRNITVNSNFAFPIVCQVPHNRDKYIKRFTTAGIEIRPIIGGNITMQPFYKKYFTPMYLKNASHIHISGFYCGNYPELTKSDLDTISFCLRER